MAFLVLKEFGFGLFFGEKEWKCLRVFLAALDTCYINMNSK